jgi:glycosyltransferase involved in cell wall biosynthesis
MKIVHCFFTGKTGGAQILAATLMNDMCALHEMHLVIVNDQWNDELLKQLDKKIRVHFINRKEGSRNPFPLIKLNLLFAQLKPDVIHCHEWNMARLIKTGRGKMMYTVHDVGLETSACKSYNKVVAISDAVSGDVINRTKLHPSKVYNGIPLHHFKKKSNYLLASDAPFKIVQLSRLLHQKKGQLVLLNALYLLINKYNLSNISLDFIGTGESEALLIEKVKELKLESHVCFLGEKNRTWLYEHLCDYELLVQPSLYEGFGLTIVEGFAAGLPVLASDIDGPAEIVSKTPAGFLFKNGDEQACAEGIAHMIELYKSRQIKSLMRQTHPVIQQQYSIESCASQYLKLYKQMAG